MTAAALDLALALDLTRRAAAGDEVALEQLVPVLRDRTGYTLPPPGGRASRWRTALRAWTAYAAGRAPGTPGPPPGPATRAVTVRLPLEVAAWLRAQGGGPARTVERLCREAMDTDASCPTCDGTGYEPDGLRTKRKETMR